MAREEKTPGPLDRRQRRSIIREAIADNVRAPGELPPSRARRDAGAREGKSRLGIGLIAVALALAALGAGAMALLRDAAPTSTASGVDSAAAGAPNAASGTPSNAISPKAASSAFEAPVGVDSSLFPLAVERITIDAGHGGADDGTSNEQVSEKDLTLDIALRLAARLEAGGYEAILTRTDDTALSLRERVQIANERRSDLFVSIHLNWFASETVRGVETYYLGATEDPELMALAQRENRESGYQLADLRSLLDGVYADLRQDESRRFAARVQRALYRSLLPISPELRDRGVKSAPFVVLVATEMPAILAEVSCLSNQQEVERLARPRYREHIAEALFTGIEAYARDVNQKVEKGS